MEVKSYGQLYKFFYGEKAKTLHTEWRLIIFANLLNYPILWNNNIMRYNLCFISGLPNFILPSEKVRIEGVLEISEFEIWRKKTFVFSDIEVLYSFSLKKSYKHLIKESMSYLFHLWGISGHSFQIKSVSWEKKIVS